ncbi:hypothetical protein [Phenylobacterium sp.]|jgi:hypothetical protein|uniref:hypothetical protein n=1 Tax=Phenylobacterium sp. TaxID=1871053 RepID=UPI002F95315A
MTYTLVITGPDGRQQTTLTDYRDDDTTIADVRHLLSAHQPSIAIARGHGDQLQFLGAWAWRSGTCVWTPDQAGEPPAAADVSP